MSIVAKRLSEIPRSATVSVADRAAALRSQGIAVIDMSAGRAVEHTPGYICDAAVAAIRGGQTHQTVSSGTPEYRRACAEKLRRENGIDADPAREIVATMGVKQGLTLALMATVDPGDEVIVEDPCFVSYQPLIRLCGGVPVGVPLRKENRFRWTREDIESHLSSRTRVILMNSPHNPTGTVHTEADLDLAGRIAAERDLAVITDEVYERATWGGRKHVSLATRPGMRERTIAVMGLTKTFSMGGWRIGFVHGPADLIQPMISLQQHLITCAGSFTQAGAAQAFTGAAPGEVREMWEDWERRCAFVCSEVGRLPGVDCAMPEGGFYSWPDIRATGWDDVRLADHLLEKHHVAIVPGSAFGPNGRGFLRLTCVRSWPDLKEAVKRIRRALGEEAPAPPCDLKAPAL
ncbi:MAG: pyridoxal phosphate-dependent aminotransferase [Acidobacteria bacterium]|nr:pyridoxal phosphate-dependent aminotransferase [Acidobacteriota bacterium]